MTTHVSWDLKIEQLDSKEISILVDFIEKAEPENESEYQMKRRLLKKIYYATVELEDFQFDGRFRFSV